MSSWSSVRIIIQNIQKCFRTRIQVSCCVSYRCWSPHWSAGPGCDGDSLPTGYWWLWCQTPASLPPLPTAGGTPTETGLRPYSQNESTAYEMWSISEVIKSFSSCREISAAWLGKGQYNFFPPASSSSLALVNNDLSLFVLSNVDYLLTLWPIFHSIWLETVVRSSGLVKRDLFHDIYLHVYENTCC